MGSEQGEFKVIVEDGTKLGRKFTVDKEHAVPLGVEQDAKTYDTAG